MLELIADSPWAFSSNYRAQLLLCTSLAQGNQHVQVINFSTRSARTWLYRAHRNHVIRFQSLPSTIYGNMYISDIAPLIN